VSLDAGGSLLASSVTLGSSGGGNVLRLENGGQLTATSELLVGSNTTSTGNQLLVTGSTVRVTNTTGSATLDIRRGTNLFNGGLMVADRLLLTNGSLSRFTFNSGTLTVRTSVVNNGAVFIVGNGTSSATLNLLSNGTHTFANNLIVSSNAEITGSGTLLNASVASFGNIVPGNTSAGALTIATNLLLYPSARLTFGIGGLIATNQYDQINVGSLLQMAGTLSLELLGRYLPEPEDTFTLLTFGSQSGSFTNIMGGRVSLTNNLASFAVTQTATNLQLSGVSYVDTDGDGQGDLQELAAGTDPNVSSSYIRITSLTQNGSGHYVIQFPRIVVIQGPTIIQKAFRIEWTDDFVTWNAVIVPLLTSPVPDTWQWVDDGTLTGGLGTGQRFYRVGLR
jgi:hypothetical protein